MLIPSPLSLIFLIPTLVIFGMLGVVIALIIYVTRVNSHLKKIKDHTSDANYNLSIISQDLESVIENDRLRVKTTN